MGEYIYKYINKNASEKALIYALTLYNGELELWYERSIKIYHPYFNQSKRAKVREMIKELVIELDKRGCQNGSFLAERYYFERSNKRGNV